MVCKDINDYLVSVGLPVLGRSLTKSTMKVKNFHETKWNKNLQPYPCYALQKHDGINGILVNYDHQYMFFTREGKRMQNMQHIEKFYSDSKFPFLLNSMVNAEVCNDKFSLEELGAVIKSSRKKALSDDEESKHTGTYLVAFDMVNLDEFLEGKSDSPFSSRLSKILIELPKFDFKVPKFRWCKDEANSDYFFTYVVNQGGEGAVQVLPNSPWVAGYKNHYKTKKVRGVDYDLEVIGIKEGKGKRSNMVGNLIVRWRDYGDLSNPARNFDVDGRFTDSIRVDWFNNPAEIIGKIVHVHALQMGSQGSLRLAKVHEVRIDKTKADL